MASEAALLWKVECRAGDSARRRSDWSWGMQECVPGAGRGDCFSHLSQEPEACVRALLAWALGSLLCQLASLALASMLTAALGRMFEVLE